jgi:hypothetical protein
MSFLAPLFLLGGLAIVGPVVFHLVRRSVRERTVFSSVMFFSPSRPRLTRRSRLEYLLLLFLRALAIALLALGFARPFLHRPVPAAAAPADARRVVVLLDTSASMRRTGLWDAAKSRAASILRSLKPGDEAAVVSFSRSAAPLVTFEEWAATPPAARASLALSRLDALAPGWLDDHLGDAVIRAAELLAASGGTGAPPGPRDIYLISDLTAGSHLESLQGYDWPKGLALHAEQLPALAPTNAGLQWVAESADTDRLSAPTVRVRVRNSPVSKREQFQVGWADAQGRYLSPPLDVYVPPGQSRVFAVPLLAKRDEMRRITLQGDDEAFDNMVYVVPTEQRHWTVSYYGADAPDDPRGSLFFLERAFPPSPPLSVNFVAGETPEAKLAVLRDGISPEKADGLRHRLEAGLAILAAPSSRQFSSTLRILLADPTATLTDIQPADYALFGQIDFTQPIFAPFADPHYSDFTKIHIWRYRKLAADAAGRAAPPPRVLASFDSGDPALIDYGIGRGHLLLLLTGWNPGDSELALSSKFVPLLSSILDFAAGSAEAPAQYFVGDLKDADRPGLYPPDPAHPERLVAVNLSPSVSRTEPLPADELERFGAPSARPEATPAQTAQAKVVLAAAEAESRQKLWRWILGAAVVVLLIESGLAGWTARREALTVGADKAA